MTSNPFSLNFNFEPGKICELQPNIRRIIAPNSSPMTFSGTNTYLVGKKNIAVIDPGPKIECHLNSILDNIKLNQSITHILITHSHVDHSPLAKALQDQTGAPIYGYGDNFAGRSEIMVKLAQNGNLEGGEGLDPDFVPDILLKDGDVLKNNEWQFDVIWTPGHLGNHLCFGLKQNNALFSADHVMGWATSLVSPPDGDLTQFMNSLKKLLEFKDYSTYYPGHGDKITQPEVIINYILKHREMREKQVLSSIKNKSLNATEIAQDIYLDVNPALIPAAARNVFAHLIDLRERQLVKNTSSLDFQTKFTTV